MFRLCKFRHQANVTFPNVSLTMTLQGRNM